MLSHMAGATFFYENSKSQKKLSVAEDRLCFSSGMNINGLGEACQRGGNIIRATMHFTASIFREVITKTAMVNNVRGELHSALVIFH